MKTGKPRNPGLKTNRRRKSAGLATNYGMMLQIYCLNKNEETMKKGLKYEKLVSGKSIPAASKPSYSISAMVVSFLNESLLLLKKVRPGVAIVTE
ncbi:MAG: hypothetical protein WKG06_10245 [Segetibacter sp.]